MSTIPAPSDIVTYWAEAGHAKWFGKDTAFDDELRERFMAAHFAAARRELEEWRETPTGALALLILLDQVPRNVFGGSAHAWATDPLALSLADDVVEREFDLAIDLPLRIFFYLPFEHSESPADQERAVALNRERGDAESLKWAEIHRDVVARFGRFPHRNGPLGRTTTPEEQVFLHAGGFGG